MIVPSKIPSRQWLLGTTFCRRFLSGLIGEGGAGKTAVRVVQYLALATGRKLTDEYVHVRGRVLIVCLEDYVDEIKRRIAAAMIHFEIPAEEVEPWLYFWAPRRMKLLEVDPQDGLVV